MKFWKVIIENIETGEIVIEFKPLQEHEATQLSGHIQQYIDSDVYEIHIVWL